MRKCLLVVATCLAFGVASLAVPVQAQDTGTKTKTMTPQRQKMKDCAVKWKEEKAEKHVGGKNAYRAFMKDCLKG